MHQENFEHNEQYSGESGLGSYGRFIYQMIYFNETFWGNGEIELSVKCRLIFFNR